MSLVLSNEAFRYCSVPFIQMCKEANTMLAYALSYAVGKEPWNWARHRVGKRASCGSPPEGDR